jgi:ABC-type spermidine/putrescine transport system permease subunit II
MTRAVLRLLAAIGFILMVAPLVAVIVNAFNSNAILSGWDGFTTSWFGSVVHDSEVRDATIRSIEVAAAVTAISTVVGTLTVAFSAYVPAPVRALTDGLTITRVMVPEIIMSAGLIIVLPEVGFRFGLETIIIGQSVWAIAFFIAIAGARRAGFDRRLEDAARDLGASPFRVLRTIVIPDLMPGIVAAALLTFTFSFDDVITTVFLSGAGSGTLPTLILARIRHGITPEINAIGVMVMIATITLLALATLASGSLTPARAREPNA